MTIDEACDVIMWVLFDRESATPRPAGRGDFCEILASHGCGDEGVAYRAGKLLRDHGMLTGYAACLDSRISADISPSAFRIMEKMPHGSSVMAILDRPCRLPAGAGSPNFYGPVFQGDVHNSNVAIRVAAQ